MGEKQNKNKDILKDTTCFSEHRKFAVNCTKESCKFWIDHHTSQNCTLILADKGPQTLQEIGEIFGITRMRICQIEKTILQKLRKKRKFLKLSEF